jgi:hypothetical protein
MLKKSFPLKVGFVLGIISFLILIAIAFVESTSAADTVSGFMIIAGLAQMPWALIPGLLTIQQLLLTKIGINTGVYVLASFFVAICWFFNGLILGKFVQSFKK